MPVPNTKNIEHNHKTMRKILHIAILLCVASLSAHAQSECRVVCSNYHEIRLYIVTPQPTIGHLQYLGEKFSTLTMEGYISLGQNGQPDLPLLTRMLEVPVNDVYEIIVGKVHYDTLDGNTLGINHPIIPAQPSRSKSDTTTPTLVIDKEMYSTDAFFGTDAPVSVEHVGVARNRNLALLRFSPVSYNPVTNQVVVCRGIDVTIRFINPNVAASKRMRNLHACEAFHIGTPTLNTLSFEEKDIAVTQNAPIHYLIVAHNSFRGQLDSLINWKQRIGFIVTVAYTDQPEVGSTTGSISAYIRNFYNNATPQLPAPAFLLLVGDVDQIPAFTGCNGYSGPDANATHVTDLYYATWSRGDSIPDCHYGRFSAQNISQLTPQIEKTLMYERYAFPDPQFLNRAVLVAGEDRGSANDNAFKYADPTMDYATKYYITRTNGYNSITYYKNNNGFAPNGVTVTGCSLDASAADSLAQAYSRGAGWINYSAHGSPSGWHSPAFNTTDRLPYMSNTNRAGVMVGNCCSSCEFQEDECFAEAVLRKSDRTGATVYIGASESTYWKDDFYWSVGLRNSSDINNTMNATYDPSNLGMYDRLFHTHSEAYADHYTSAGAMIMAGNMAVQSSSSSGKAYYWEIYHLMGDPSLQPWLGLATPMNVSTNTTSLVAGATSFQVTAVPHAYVALTNGQGALIGATFADAAGIATLTFDPITAGIYELAATAQGYIPSFTTITTTMPTVPYVVSDSISSSNGQHLIAGRPQPLNLLLNNVGVNATQTLSVEFSSPDGKTTFATSGAQTVSNIASSSTMRLNAVNTATVRESVSDQSLVQIAVTVRWGTQASESTTRTFTMVADAAQITKLDESVTFSGNQYTLIVNYANTGHSGMGGITIHATPLDPDVRTSSIDNIIDTLPVNATCSDTFHFTINTSQTIDDDIPVHVTFANRHYSRTDPVMLPCGTRILTFENLTQFPSEWTQGNHPWVITSTAGEVRYGSRCARSANNLQDEEDSELSVRRNALANDSISFDFNVSSENNYDKFKFYIDDTSKLVASGTNNTWRHVSYPVSAGRHTFKFVYSKDYSQNDGRDCAWIDNVRLPANTTVRIYQADTVGRGTVYTFHGLTINTADSACGTYYYRDESESNRIYILMLTIDNSDPGVGVTTVEETSRLLLYPNPTSGIIRIESPASTIGTPLMLFNMRGQLIMTRTATTTPTELNLHGLPCGVYVLRCGTFIEKIIKK